MDNSELILGNKNYSSWSMRPWLAMKVAGIKFNESVVALMEVNHRADFDEAFPAGKVPVLRIDGHEIWESLAICEYVNEISSGYLWPEDVMARAKARAVSAEMASGFMGLRSQYPMNCRRDIPGIVPDEAAARDIARIEAIWAECLDENKDTGPYLFGKYFSIADAMFAPVVTRFKTYGLAKKASSKAYMETILSMPEMKDWYAAAVAEEWAIDKVEL